VGAKSARSPPPFECGAHRPLAKIRPNSYAPASHQTDAMGARQSTVYFDEEARHASAEGQAVVVCAKAPRPALAIALRQKQFPTGLANSSAIVENI